MSNFWQKALGTTAPAAPAPAPSSGSGPWWNQPVLPPSASQPQTVPQQVVQQPAPPVTKAQSARLTAYCPECGSDNYFKPQGHMNAMEQCYNCGYNPRFGTQSGATGMPSSDSGPATPARQVASAHTGYSGQIIGKA